MIDFFHNIITPAMLPYTVPVAISLAYWLFVICTGLDFGTEALDGALDGVLDGAMDGAVDGAVDGAIDGVADGAIDGAADGATDGAVEGAGGTLLGMILNFLNLGKVPATVVFSLIFLKMWVFAYVYHIVLKPKIGGFAIPVLAITILATLVIFVLAIFATAYTTRPLRKLFIDKIQHGAQHLIGKICQVKTNKVTAKSGQAEMVIDDSPLLILVRCSEENGLTKGHEAVIVGYDEKDHIYDIRPLS